MCGGFVARQLQLMALGYEAQHLHIVNGGYPPPTPAQLLALTRAAGAALTAYSPTAKGAGEKDPVLQRIARKHGRTPTQVALAWLLEQEGVAAIPKAAGEANQRANLEALALRLDAEDRAAIAALPKNRRLVDPGIVPDWEA